MSGDGAVFKGLAIAGPMLYATDFANACVDVFDSTFAPMSTPGAFTDSHIPSDYAPFGIQTIGDHVFVTYAKQDEDEDEAARVRPGLRRRVHDHGRPRPPRRKPRRADRPLGPAAAPDNFGALGGHLLVGN